MMSHGSSVLAVKDGQEADEKVFVAEGIAQQGVVTNDSNSAVVPIDTLNKWGNLLAYELFNQIQNMMSVFVFDARPLPNYEAVRIQGSLFLPTDMLIDSNEGLRVIIGDFIKNRNSRTDKIGVVLVLSDETQTKQLTDLISSCIESASGTIASDLDGNASTEKGFLCSFGIRRK